MVDFMILYVSHFFYNACGLSKLLSQWQSQFSTASYLAHPITSLADFQLLQWWQISSGWKDKYTKALFRDVSKSYCTNSTMQAAFLLITRASVVLQNADINAIANHRELSLNSGAFSLNWWDSIQRFHQLSQFQIPSPFEYFRFHRSRNINNHPLACHVPADVMANKHIGPLCPSWHYGQQAQ